MTGDEHETRLRTLLKVTQTVSQELDLGIVLQRIVEAAVELVGARYGALGVIAPDGHLEQFIHVGMSDGDIARLGHLPEGHGLLGALIEDPHPIRVDHLARESRSVGFPANHPPMESFLGVPVRVRDEIFGNLYLTNQHDGHFSAEDEELVTTLAASAGFAINNARNYAETRRRQAWADASAEITATILSDDDIDPVSIIAARVGELAGAESVRFIVRADDTARVTPQPSAPGHARAPYNETEDDHRAPTMIVPLRLATGERGVLVVTRAVGAERFTDADLDMAVDFAARGSVAKELRASRAEAQRLMILEDRGRIAEDLHDHVIQGLYATGLQLQSVAGTLGPGRAADRVEASIDNIDAAITQIRTAIFALSSSRTESEPALRNRVIDVVRDLAPGLAQTPHISFAGPIDMSVTGSLADDVVAVVRETLTNVSKHAAADQTSVALSVSDGRVTLSVEDDGVGIPADRPTGNGLGNLAARATRRGGEFTFDSRPGQTRAVWSAPMTGSAPADITTDTSTADDSTARDNTGDAA
ncbi:GAF domain-containing sensor histidine kinase [Glaciihabitans sp. dw_435]|uniref:GAF domain-containing sensor histidine kinase n=1 Tax=Glaciihabitans sp. dw_435 TaxID=2720081 RepID=UPI001BD5D106|nr:GAF domain-containing sensor histidine kinase [Glaciihabitans sp. dw_435]